jgi:hypothetical protein
LIGIVIGVLARLRLLDTAAHGAETGSDPRAATDIVVAVAEDAADNGAARRAAGRAADNPTARRRALGIVMRGLSR